MTHRHYGPSTPPFAFPALLADAALGRLRFERPARVRTRAAGPGPAAIVVTGLFLEARERAPSTLAVMDLGAEGDCGRLLDRRGVSTIVAVGPRPAASGQTVYADRIVGEMTALDPIQQARLERHRFDGLVSACGLGARGIAPSDFLEAVDHVARGGWICAAFDAAVFEAGDTSGFGALVRALSVRGVFEVETLTDFTCRAKGAARELVALLARKGRAVYDA